jgi:protein-disulfide isomerase
MSAAYFLLGVVVGVVGILVFNALTIRPPLDTVAVQQASRTGVLEALATAQADRPATASESVVPTTPAAAPEVLVDMGTFTLRAANRQGDPAAPVTIVEFSDFQCPFCRALTIKCRRLCVITSTGCVGVQTLPSWGLNQIGVCRRVRGRSRYGIFTICSSTVRRRESAFNIDRLLGFAQELKLDLTRFEPCLTNEETLARVQADTQEGRQAGVTGTPTFFINGQKIAGARPYEQFRAIIEPLLVTSQ